MANSDPDDEAAMAEAMRRNQAQWAERHPNLAGWLAPATPQRVAAVVADAASHGCVLDYSPASAVDLEHYIRSIEQDTRIYLDLDDGEWVGDHVANILDLTAIGAYFGELLVRNVGAVWTTAVGEDGPEPAVARGSKTIRPLTWVRYRMDAGDPPFDLDERFRWAFAALREDKE